MLSDRSKRNFQFIKQGKGFGEVERGLCPDYVLLCSGFQERNPSIVINGIECE